VFKFIFTSQFSIISVVDCGSPNSGRVRLGRIVQATPARFNSYSPYWGKTSLDFYLHSRLAKVLAASNSGSENEPAATTLYFLSDRDILNEVSSPWGSRAPLPHFVRQLMVYALPLEPKRSQSNEKQNSVLGRFAGGGAMEVFVDDLIALNQAIKDAAADATTNATDGNATDTATDSVSDRRRRAREQVARDVVSHHLRAKRLTPSQLASVQLFLNEEQPEPEDLPKRNQNEEDSNATSDTALIEMADDDDKDENEDEDTLLLDDSSFPVDMDVDFGPKDLSFARAAYHVARIPKGKYVSILSQTLDDPSLVLIEKPDGAAAFSFKGT